MVVSRVGRFACSHWKAAGRFRERCPRQRHQARGDNKCEWCLHTGARSRRTDQDVDSRPDGHPQSVERGVPQG
jgi:hypothetical protein